MALSLDDIIDLEINFSFQKYVLVYSRKNQRKIHCISSKNHCMADPKYSEIDGQAVQTTLREK